MDLSAFAALASSLKTASDMTRALVDIRDAAKAQGLVVDLQREIMSAQSSALSANALLMELQERLRTLERRLAEVEGWESEKRRYALTDFGSETFAWELRDMSPGEPYHRLCPTCFSRGQKGILQLDGEAFSGRQLFRCPMCKQSLELGLMKDTPNW